VYYLRSKGLLHGLATGTNWVFRDESMHMAFAFNVIDTIRTEEPDLFDTNLQNEIYEMAAEAIECETLFANDVLSQGVSGLSVKDMRQYLEFVADRRFERLGMKTKYNVKNPFSFLDLQDVQELTNFFERRVSSYQVGVEGNVEFNETF
jgi:ribonucleoside-diphosphate reductase beta chain